MSEYPLFPGSKHGAEETSRIAAQAIAHDAGRLREACLEVLGRYPDGLTADEVAAALKNSILSIRPRMSELKASHRIKASGKRRPNSSGHSAVVWIATKPAEADTALFDVGPGASNAMNAIRGR